MNTYVIYRWIGMSWPHYMQGQWNLAHGVNRDGVYDKVFIGLACKHFVLLALRLGVYGMKGRGLRCEHALM